ncbi:phosducin b [Electrophorus electricus]|uniref:phosducin b n=1 Tax=Electrophorus electricus TaxID=8005 RepID=UPI0015D00419|nr:phosducin b [Electrophorus electricus]
MSGREFYKEEGTVTNTGPKGVINDWWRFKMESVDQGSLPPSKRELLKQMSSAHKPRDDSLRTLECEMSAPECERLTEDDDRSLSQYRERRMREMRERLSLGPRFGSVQELSSSQAFLSTLEREHRLTLLVVLVYRECVEGCRALSACLDCLAADYPTVHFCRIDAATSGAAERFPDDVLPAVLVYKAGEMLVSLLAVTQHFGEEFLAADVEAFLGGYGLLPEKPRAGAAEDSMGRGEEWV